MEADSMRGKFASQSVQNRMLVRGKGKEREHKKIIKHEEKSEMVYETTARKKGSTIYILKMKELNTDQFGQLYKFLEVTGWR